MTLKVIIDRKKCIGAGNCIFVAPTVYRWREGDLLKPELLDPTTVDDDVLRESAAVCPTEAITFGEPEEDLS